LRLTGDREEKPDFREESGGMNALFVICFLQSAAIAITNGIKRFHLVRFEMLDNRPAVLAYNGAHSQSPPDAECYRETDSFIYDVTFIIL
jgi:hypothetical protein